MAESPLNIVYITPGAGGMYCGSCLNDNMLASALTALGQSVCLIPVYTPTRTDEPNVSINKLFFGGINVYLQQKVPLFRHLPRIADRVFDRPTLVRRLAGRAVGLEAKQLGELTLSMVRGQHGHQRKEIYRLVDWLARQPAPDIINLSNLLIAGCVPVLRKRLGVPIVVTLQGDDLFLDDLPADYRAPVMAELRELASQVDCFMVHSDYYAGLMAEYFGVPRDKFEVVPLGITVDDYPQTGGTLRDGEHPTIGYLARICPAKGFHLLVDAFLRLKEKATVPELRLHAAGWLGADQRAYFEAQRTRISSAGHGNDFHYAGELDRRAKLQFLSTIDVLSVPATYREPKGRYVLEALASGVPVVQPEHGAFPEMLARTGGGRLFPPNDDARLAEVLGELLTDHAARRGLAVEGRTAVRQHCNAHHAAQHTLSVYRKLLGAS